MGAHLSPARQALGEQVERVAELKRKADHLSTPVARLRDQVREQTDALTAIEGDLSKIEADHAAAIAAAAQEGSIATLPKSPVSEKLLGQRETIRRTKAAVEAALLRCEADHDQAAIALRDATAELDKGSLAVLEEEFDLAIERREAARLAFIEEDLTVRALVELFRRKCAPLGRVAHDMKWIEASNRARKKYEAIQGTELSPRQFNEALARWVDALKRLATDPSARG